MNLKKYMLVLFTVLFLQGCEEIINLNLESADKQIVIEANITDLNKPVTVIITSTGDYYKPSTFEHVSGADVVITGNDGSSEILLETDPGIYQSSEIIGQSNTTYQISVITWNKEFTAHSSMPEKINIDSLSIEKRNARMNNKDNYFLHVYFKDHPGIKDYVRLRIFKNGKLLPELRSYSDRLSDGNNINLQLRLDPDDVTKIGDKFVVELHSIDKAVYDYFNELNDVSASNTNGGRGSSSAAPSNPSSNWNNKALGYFSASAVSVDSLVVVK